MLMTIAGPDCQDGQTALGAVALGVFPNDRYCDEPEHHEARQEVHRFGCIRNLAYPERETRCGVDGESCRKQQKKLSRIRRQNFRKIKATVREAMAAPSMLFVELW
jgi:hypothetical protein